MISMGTIAPLTLFVVILLLKPRWSSSFCNQEYEWAGEADFKDDAVKASSYLFCPCEIQSCAFELSYSHTSSRTHTVEGNIGITFKIFSGSVGYNHSWGQSATIASSATCTSNPGYKSWVEIVPSMTRKVGWVRKKCFGITTEEGWVEMKAPSLAQNGGMIADVWCKTSRIRRCSEDGTESDRLGQCHGINEYADTHGTYCRDNCAAGYCPPHICEC